MWTHKSSKPDSCRPKPTEASRPPQALPSSNPQPQSQQTAPPDQWRCSDKQRNFIQRIIRENNLDEAEVDHLARQRFGVPVAQLNKMQASGLIDALLDQFGSKGKGGSR